MKDEQRIRCCNIEALPVMSSTLHTISCWIIYTIILILIYEQIQVRIERRANNIVPTNLGIMHTCRYGIVLRSSTFFYNLKNLKHLHLRSSLFNDAIELILHH